MINNVVSDKQLELVIKNEIDKALAWNPVTLPTPTKSGKTVTYNIDLSQYKEICLTLWIRGWYTHIDTRIVPLEGHGRKAYLVSYHNGSTYCEGEVTYTASSITISTKSTNMGNPTENIYYIEALSGRLAGGSLDIDSLVNQRLSAIIDGAY